jgi:hypothetical protein
MSIEHGGTIHWRVSAADGLAHSKALDALLLATNTNEQAQLGETSQLLGCEVPFERRLPDIPLTLVVRANPNAGRLLVECDVLGPNGERRMYGRSTKPLAVIIRTAAGIAITGLPDAR